MKRCLLLFVVFIFSMNGFSESSTVTNIEHQTQSETIVVHAFPDNPDKLCISILSNFGQRTPIPNTNEILIEVDISQFCLEIDGDGEVTASEFVASQSVPYTIHRFDQFKFVTLRDLFNLLNEIEDPYADYSSYSSVFQRILDIVVSPATAQAQAGGLVIRFWSWLKNYGKADDMLEKYNKVVEPIRNAVSFYQKAEECAKLHHKTIINEKPANVYLLDEGGSRTITVTKLGTDECGPVTAEVSESLWWTISQYRRK